MIEMTVGWSRSLPESAADVRHETGEPDPRDANGKAWDEIIDRQLIDWANGRVDIDDDLTRPTSASMLTAFAFARACRDRGAPPPTAVLPNGDGGVQFERRFGRSSVQIEALSDGELLETEYGEQGLVSVVHHPASAVR